MTTPPPPAPDYGSPEFDWGSTANRDATGEGAPAPSAPPASPGPPTQPGQRKPDLGRLAMSLVPFVALVLFLIAGSAGGWAWSWMFFLLVPVTGIVVRELGRTP